MIEKPIEGEKVALRRLEQEDLQEFERWGSDTGWYEGIIKRRNSKIMAIDTKDGHLIGDIGLAEISWRRGDAELTIRIGDREYWSKGYGTDAVRTLIDFAFTHMKLKRIYLRVYRYNARAIRCYEKCGFKTEGMVTRRIGEQEEPVEILLMTIANNRVKFC